MSFQSLKKISLKVSRPRKRLARELDAVRSLGRNFKVTVFNCGRHCSCSLDLVSACLWQQQLQLDLIQVCSRWSLNMDHRWPSQSFWSCLECSDKHVLISVARNTFQISVTRDIKIHKTEHFDMKKCQRTFNVIAESWKRILRTFMSLQSLESASWWHWVSLWSIESTSWGPLMSLQSLESASWWHWVSFQSPKSGSWRN